jgi:hypothetical protein
MNEISTQGLLLPASNERNSEEKVIEVINVI